ncbi:hypothetical protein ACH40F_52355 [Streptomyces sp. NPDC020794]|uniref:hypothetical protein n=1 Tax=unclassified Streptomyces TaxID=2593676 RepID=UPI0036F0D480
MPTPVDAPRPGGQREGRSLRAAVRDPDGAEQTRYSGSCGRGGRPLAFDREAYKQRNAVERCINQTAGIAVEGQIHVESAAAGRFHTLDEFVDVPRRPGGHLDPGTDGAGPGEQKVGVRNLGVTEFVADPGIGQGERESELGPHLKELPHRGQLPEFRDLPAPARVAGGRAVECGRHRLQGVQPYEEIQVRPCGGFHDPHGVGVGSAGEPALEHRAGGGGLGGVAGHRADLLDLARPVAGGWAKTPVGSGRPSRPRRTASATVRSRTPGTPAAEYDKTDYRERHAVECGLVRLKRHAEQHHAGHAAPPVSDRQGVCRWWNRR